MTSKQPKKPKPVKGKRSPRKPVLINREMSWLSFNERVLQEAADAAVPLVERIRFLGIFSNNLDEFFRVRVATLHRLITLGSKAKPIIGENPRKLLKQIQSSVLKLQNRFESIYHSILRELENEDVYLINEKQLSPKQGEFVKQYFDEKVHSHLVPIMISFTNDFPRVKDKSIYLIIKLFNSGGDENPLYALVEIPSNQLSRFLILPKTSSKNYIILLDDVIRYCLQDMFAIFHFEHIEAYTIKVTRDAELDIDDDISKSFFEKVSESINERSKGEPVRFVYDATMPDDLLKFLMKSMNLDQEDTLIPGGRYHNFKDFMSFPNIGAVNMEYTKMLPLFIKAFKPYESLLDVVKERDIMLHYPYQTFNHFIDLLREAAIDPKVTSIKITLYRVASNSKVINALINAVKNGKSVTVVMELQARFDEEANLGWSKKLEEEGVKVIFGVPGLKVHAKLCLITRKEGKSIMKYANIGTGNYNENTAEIYCDEGLFTANKKITDEVQNVFSFVKNNYKTFTYKHLIVAPNDMRRKYLRLINTEIKNAKAGKPAYIWLKLNNLVDDKLIKKLYDASNAGVQIKLIVRGICSIVPGIPGMSDNIEGVSIIDKYLEHSRIIMFANGGDEKYFITSADWMRRNLDYRMEVTCPVYDPDIQKEIKEMLEIQWSDNVKARILNDKQDNQYKRKHSKNTVRAQLALYDYFRSRNK